MLSYRIDHEDIMICIIFVFQFNHFYSLYYQITTDAKHTNHPNIRIDRGVGGEYRRRVIERSQHIQV